MAAPLPPTVEVPARATHPSPRAGTKTLMWAATSPPPESARPTPTAPRNVTPAPQAPPAASRPPEAADTRARTPLAISIPPLGLPWSAPTPSALPAVVIPPLAPPTAAPSPMPALPQSRPAAITQPGPIPTATSGTLEPRGPTPSPMPTFVSSATRGGTLFGSASSLEVELPAAPPPGTESSSITGRATAPMGAPSAPSGPRMSLTNTAMGGLMLPVFSDEDQAARDAAPPGAPRGTAVGHSISRADVTQSLPDPGDDRSYKGTLHGHSLHLPLDLNELTNEVQPATVHAAPSATTAGSLAASATSDADFSRRGSGMLASAMAQDARDADDPNSPDYRPKRSRYFTLGIDLHRRWCRRS